MTSNGTENQSKKYIGKKLPFRLGIVALGLVILWMYSALQGGNLLKTGTAAPDWTMEEPNAPKRSLSLADLKGKVIVFDFWSLGCPPCMQMVAELDAVSRQFSKDDVAVVGVSAWGESRNDVFKMKRTRRLDYRLLVGTREVVGAYKVSSLPTLYIIDKNGEIALTHQGYWPREKLADAINELLD